MKTPGKQTASSPNSADGISEQPWVRHQAAFENEHTMTARVRMVRNDDPRRIPHKLHHHARVWIAEHFLAKERAADVFFETFFPGQLICVDGNEAGIGHSNLLFYSIVSFHVASVFVISKPQRRPYLGRLFTEISSPWIPIIFLPTLAYPGKVFNRDIDMYQLDSCSVALRPE